MIIEDINANWNKEQAIGNLKAAFESNSELRLLAVLKDNSFMFYELFSRKYGIQPVFHEVSFGGNFRCDFAWLNDSSDGPEWVLVEIEEPRLEILTKKGEPTQKLNHALEQVKSWRRYFDENPGEKRRIFGAVGRFRLILVAGNKESWVVDKAAKWRIDNNKETKIEIRTSDIFWRALDILENHPEELWSFVEHPKTLPPSMLVSYWEGYDYMNAWRRLIN